MTSDAELVRAWRDGDADAGDVLVERHYDAPVRFFRTKTSRGEDDLVQKTFLVCAERLSTYQGQGTFRAFLFGIARNVLFEHYRSKAKDGRSDDAIAASSVVDLAPGVSTQAYRRAEHRVLIDALQRIPLELQLVIELYYWEELGIDELAQLLEVPEGTVKSRLHRARTILRESMEGVSAKDLGESADAPAADAWARRFRSLRPDDPSS